jgi:2-keto-4-pentenoate hydratase/2-oxohepta-3-ene-1,7-dioic acid hydratase in catechol pathway
VPGDRSARAKHVPPTRTTITQGAITMKLANVAGRASLILDGRVLDLERASGGSLSSDPMTVADLSRHGEIAALGDSCDVDALPLLEESTLGAPVPRPSKVIALALNYASHVIESNKTMPEEPHVMVKFPSSICGPFDTIIAPAGRPMIDFEAEIVLVIGKQCKAVAEADAWEVVAGIMAGNDISDRGEQFRPPIKQFSMAKSYDTFGPCGPLLVTPEEFSNRDDIALDGWVDGLHTQTARSSDFIFSVQQQIAWLSRFVTLNVGDHIWTGTTGGVGESRTPELWLTDGSVVETRVEIVGTMRNPVKVG